MNKGHKRNCIQEISKYKDLEGKTKKKQVPYISAKKDQGKNILKTYQNIIRFFKKMYLRKKLLNLSQKI